MPSRRYYIMIAPFDHVNGKMAPVAVKCPNTEGHQTFDGFWYGYRRPKINVSRYGIRTHGRDLSEHPYTPAEDENRTLFTTSLHSVYTHKAIAPDWTLMLQDFARQTRYTTPIGFAVAACRSNGGEWLTDWIA